MYSSPQEENMYFF